MSSDSLYNPCKWYGRHHHHHHHHHHHLSLNREGRLGTTDDFTTVSSIFLCSPLSSGTWRTPGLSIPWWCLPTSSSVCLVFFPLSPCLAKWFWPDLMNGKYVSHIGSPQGKPRKYDKGQSDFLLLHFRQSTVWFQSCQQCCCAQSCPWMCDVQPNKVRIWRSDRDNFSLSFFFFFFDHTVSKDHATRSMQLSAWPSSTAVTFKFLCQAHLKLAYTGKAKKRGYHNFFFLIHTDNHPERKLQWVGFFCIYW